MEFHLRSQDSLSPTCPLVIGLYTNQSFFPSLKTIDASNDHILSKQRDHLKEEGDFHFITLKEGTVVLIHFGDENAYTLSKFKTRLSQIVSIITQQRYAHVQIAIPELSQFPFEDQIYHMIVKMDQCLYQFQSLKSHKKPYAIKNIDIICRNTEMNLSKAFSVIEGIRLTRDLANLPANLCTPSFLAEQALLLAKTHPEIKTKILDAEALRKLGMNLFLSVAAGSHEPPKFI